jgi:putative SbcD/Mre11-related phosphoesterase
MKIKYIGKCLYLFDEEEGILVVGDLHLGYEEVLNKTGVMVGRKLFDEMILDFDGVFNKLKSEKRVVSEIVLLGDIKHSFGSIMKQEWGDFDRLVNYFNKKFGGKIIITKGNHDVLLKPVVKNYKNVELVEFYFKKGFGFLHGNKVLDDVKNKKIKTLVMGHWHPAIKLKDNFGVKVENFKCYFIGKLKDKKLILVPSFSEYSVGSSLEDTNFENVWKGKIGNFGVKIVSGLEVLDFGKLKKL